jgi:hypothetical protein
MHWWVWIPLVLLGLIVVMTTGARLFAEPVQARVERGVPDLALAGAPATPGDVGPVPVRLEHVWLRYPAVRGLFATCLST